MSNKWSPTSQNMGNESFSKSTSKRTMARLAKTLNHFLTCQSHWSCQMPKWTRSGHADNQWVVQLSSPPQAFHQTVSRSQLLEGVHTFPTFIKIASGSLKLTRRSNDDNTYAEAWALCTSMEPLMKECSTYTNNLSRSTTNARSLTTTQEEAWQQKISHGKRI